MDEQIKNETEIKTVSLVAFEAQAERNTRIIKGIVACWTLSFALFASVLIVVLR